MFCTHCAYDLDEKKVEMKRSSFSDIEGEINDDTKVGYICPRCGHLIKSDLNEKELKTLSQAAHAQVQRGRNFFATGMGSFSIGVIGAVIAILFFFLAKKPSNHYVLVTTCAEFYVFIVLGVLSVILLAVGGTNIFKGLTTKKKYETLLKDINNRTFVQ
jgi:hypothetical protein